MMKGLLKGLRYFSHMFEEEKEPEIQIGAPTDVKHVAHIGWDGPSSVETPSWMKEFKTSGGFESASIGPAAPGNSRENRDNNNRFDEGKSTRDLPDLPKSSRANISPDYSIAAAQSPIRDPSTTKSKQPRRHQSKDSSDGPNKATGIELDQSPSRNPPDIPKKSRRKKSKESINVGPSKSSRPKVNSSNSTRDTMPPYPDPGSCNEPVLGSTKDNNNINNNNDYPYSSYKPNCTRGNEEKW
ncbi:hypothetical protein LguiB_000392 [Lonicera macranthoides]